MAAGDSLNVLFRVGGEGFDEITQQTINLARGVEGATVKVDELKRSLRGIIDNKRELEEYLNLLTTLGSKHGGSISTQQGIDFLGRQENFDRGDRTRISNTLGLYDKADEVTKRWIAAMESQITRMNSGGSMVNPEVTMNSLRQTLEKDLPFSSGQARSMKSAGMGTVDTAEYQAAAREQERISEWLARLKISHFREVQQEEDRELRASMSAQERAAKFVMDMKIRYFREEQSERERIDRQAITEAEATARRVQSIVDRGSMAAAPNSTGRLNVQRNIALRGITDPGQIASVNTSFDQQIAGQGGTGGSYRLLRGLAQTGIGAGMLGPRAYNLVSGISNVSGGGGWGSMFGGGAAEGEAGGGGGGFLAANAGAIAGTTIGLGLLAAAQIAAANSASQHVRELRNLGEQLGTTIQGARQLEGAARISGVSIDAIGAGMRQLTQGVEESYGRGMGASSVLNSIGVSPTDSNGGLKDTRDLLVDISKALQNKGDLESRDILERLFGRGGRQLLPLMKQNLDDLLKSVDALNGGFNDKSALQYAEGMSRVGLMFDSLKEKFATPLFWVVEMIDNTKKGTFWSNVFNNVGNGEMDTATGGDSSAPSVMPGWMKTQQGLSAKSALNIQNRNRAKLDATPEGLRKMISQTEQNYTSALNVANRPPSAGDTDSTMQTKWDDVNRQGALLEQQKAQLKAMEAKDPNKGYLAGLQRQVNRADANDYDGFARSSIKEIDSIDAAKERNMPSAEYAKSVSLIKQLHAEEDILTQKVIDRANATAKARIAMQGAQFDIAQNRSVSRATQARSRIGGGQRQNIADAYGAEMENASDAYDSNAAAIKEMQTRLDDPALKEEERGPLAQEIAEKRRQNVTTIANATTNAASAAITAYTKLNIEAAAAQMKFNEAMEKGNIAASNLAASLSSEQTIAGIQQTGGLSQVVSSRTPGGAGRTANIQLSTALATIAEKRRALDAQHSATLAEDSGDLGRIGSDGTLNETQRTEEQRRKMMDIQSEDLNYEREKGRLQAEYQAAYYNRAKTTLELEMDHLQAIRDMAGQVFDAATSGGRGGPVDALSKLGISTGKSIGRTVFGNIAVATVGRVLGTGSLEIPGQVEMEIDPNTGKSVPKKDKNGNDQLTALGKVLQGTPFGHHQKSPVEQKVDTIDKNADKMRQDLDMILDIMRSGTPMIPGGTVSQLPGISLPGMGGPGGDGNGFLSSANILGKLMRGGGSSSGGGEGGFSVGDVLGSGMIFQNQGGSTGTPAAGTSGPGGKGLSGLAFPSGGFGPAGTNINGATVGMAATGILTAIGGIMQGGGKGIATAVGGGLETVGAGIAMFGGPPGLIIGGAIAAVGAATSAIAQLMGSSKQDRLNELNNFATNNRWTAPAAYNLVTGTDGRSMTPDIFGAPRAYNGPLLAYPNTSSYNSAYDYTFNKNYGGPVPVGQPTLPSTQLPIVVHIMAMDAQSMADRKHDIATVVASAMAEGHAALNAEVQNTANKL